VAWNLADYQITRPPPGATSWTVVCGNAARRLPALRNVEKSWLPSRPSALSAIARR